MAIDGGRKNRICVNLWGENMRLIIWIYGLSRLPSCDSPLSFVLQMEILCGTTINETKAEIRNVFLRFLLLSLCDPFLLLQQTKKEANYTKAIAILRLPLLLKLFAHTKSQS